VRQVVLFRRLLAGVGQFHQLVDLGREAVLVALVARALDSVVRALAVGLEDPLLVVVSAVARVVADSALALVADLAVRRVPQVDPAVHLDREAAPEVEVVLHSAELDGSVGTWKSSSRLRCRCTNLRMLLFLRVRSSLNAARPLETLARSSTELVAT
jgi:DUF1680 family protein